MLQFLDSSVASSFMGPWQMDLIRHGTDIGALLQALVEEAGLAPESQNLRGKIWPTAHADRTKKAAPRAAF
jgi:hypothetical protein